MGSDAKAAYGASGRGELLFFEPDTLTIITDDKSHPLYDERHDPEAPGFKTDESLQWLVNSLLALGQKQPITVRKNGLKKDGSPNVEVCIGRCRVRAAVMANAVLKKKKLPPIRITAVTERGDDVDFAAASIAENEIRQGDSPIVRGRKAVRFMQLYGRSLEETAVHYGISTTQMKTDLAIVDTDLAVQTEVAQGKLPAAAAKQLAKLPRAEQKKALDRLKASGETKGKGAVRAAAREAGGLQGAPMLGKRAIVKIARRLQEVPFDGGYHPSVVGAMVLRFVAGEDQEFATQHPWHATGEGRKPRPEPQR